MASRLAALLALALAARCAARRARIDLVCEDGTQLRRAAWTPADRALGRTVDTLLREVA